MATAHRFGDGIAISFASLRASSSEKDRNHRPRPAPSELESQSSEQQRSSNSETNNSPLLPFEPRERLITHLYVVTKAYLVRVGKDARIEPPAIRSEVIAICTCASRARELARRAWRQIFAYAIPEDKTEEVDMIALENRFPDGSVELLRIVNETFVCEEDGVEVSAGERRVGVWRVRLDCAEGGEEVDGAKTPVSE